MGEVSLAAQRLKLFPISTRLQEKGEHTFLSIAHLDLTALADEYGTPLYLYDAATLDADCEEYRLALKKYYPAESGLTYAGKAFLCLAMAQWVERKNLWVDCTGAGEIAIAVAAGIPRSRLLVHGVNKTPADLQAALSYAGTIVIDHLGELEALQSIFTQYSETQSDKFPNLWLRLRPGVTVDTHAHIQTGQEESKFGLSLEEARIAVHRCLQARLPLEGLHFHLGSKFRDPEPLGDALEAVLDLANVCWQAEGWQPRMICPGGGWGVPYHEDDLPHPTIESYIQFLCEALISGLQRRGLELPVLQLEPGRSLVARAGVALYRVGGVKHSRQRRWLLLDGGLADNPRPALYGARYTSLPASDPDRPSVGTAWLAGPYCESGDILIQDLPLPEIAPGEILAIPVSGAYHLSMGSNYNGARRPAVLWLKDGHAALIQERETPADLLRRDKPLP